jgi:hypothetical protein
MKINTFRITAAYPGSCRIYDGDQSAVTVHDGARLRVERALGWPHRLEAG